MNRKSEQILKVDTAGRVWTPREQREAALDEFERRGMPASKFAERIGVKYSTFASWAHQRRKQHGCAGAVRERRGEPAALKWVVAVPGDTSPSPAARALVVHLPGGVRMEIADGAQAVIAAGLLRALGAGGAGCAEFHRRAAGVPGGGAGGKCAGGRAARRCADGDQAAAGKGRCTHPADLRCAEREAGSGATAADVARVQAQRQPPELKAAS